MPRTINGLPAPDFFVQPYSTGAALVYIQFGPTATPVFFGTCEGFPKHRRRTQFMPLKNDISGRQIPIDMSFQGQDATLSLDMTVWDEGVSTRLHRIPDINGLAGTPAALLPGSWRFVDVGALMGLELMSCTVIISYPFAVGRPAYSTRLVGGYRYFQCIPMESGTEEGAQPMMRDFNFYIWPRCNFQNQSFVLYDNNVTSVQQIPINGPIAA